MIRIIQYSLLAILLFVLTDLYCFFTATTDGLKAIINISSQFLPGHLVVNKVQGRLFSAFSLEDIHYQNLSQDWIIKGITVQWQPKSLWLGKIAIENFLLDDTQIKLIPHAKIKMPDGAFLKYLRVKNLTLKNIDLTRANLHLQLSGSLNQAWHAQWHLQIKHMETLWPKLTGTLQSTGSITGQLYTPSIQTVITGDQAQLGIRGQVAFDRPALNAAVTVNLPNGSIMPISISLPVFAGLTGSQPIVGKAELSVNNLQFITHYWPVLKNPQGNVQLLFKLSGALNQPIFNSEMTLRQGMVTIPRLGITLNKINFDAAFDEHKKLNYSGTAQSGSGHAIFQGLTDFSQPFFPTTLHLQGQNLEAVNLAEIKVQCTPDLQLQYAQQHLDLTGKIAIPKAIVTPKNFSHTVSLPSDVVIVDQPKVEGSLPFTTTMQINITGEDIFLHYNDLEATLHGHLQIMQDPDSPATAVGSLAMTKGTYHAFGRDLIIQDGHFVYTGNQLTNPGLNIKAVRQINSIKMNESSHFYEANANSFQAVPIGNQLIMAGLQINGTLNHPATTLFSVPSDLSQNDILSYLLFGYPQSQANGHDVKTILSAASSLNLGGSMTKKIQEKLGLNELNVESTQIFDPVKNTVVPTTSLVVGKQLARDLYVHYSIGLFNPVSVLNLRYILSKRFSIQSETSNIDNGADLLYGIERGD